MSTACTAATFEGSGCRGTITDGQCSEQDDHHPTPGMLPYDGPGAGQADTGQAREIHNLLGQLADRSTSPDVLDSATEHVVRTNVRNGRPTSARFVGLVLAELDQARATRPSGDTVQAPAVAVLPPEVVAVLEAAQRLMVEWHGKPLSSGPRALGEAVRALLATDTTPAVAS